MGFSYKKGKGHSGEDSMWTSYSDLFLGLSIIFLLLYVSASLRQGTDGIKQNLENKRISKENEDLKQQIKAYETLKQNYLNQQASADEKENYSELMDKLSLLQDEAKEEKSKLEQQADANAKKAQALNKYQQMIRNIVNSNLIAKGRIKNRDVMIEDQDETITDQKTEINTLEKTVAQKQAEIRQNEAQLTKTNQQLAGRMQQLRDAYKAQRISKAKFEQQQAQAKQDAENRIDELRAKANQTRSELARASQELQVTSQRLADATGAVNKLGQEKNRLEGELASAAARHQSDIDGLKGQFEAQKAADRGAFEAALAKEKLTGAQRAAKEAAFAADAKRKAGELAGQLADMDKKFRDSQGALAKAQENLNARKNLAKGIKDRFGAAGVKAEVDEGTGDVLLSFGDEYFDTGASNLKPKMRAILEKAMPAYSASLFENPKVASKIQSVEIVGFASPTYKGRFVDPKSLEASDREAINYNLDLSYNRARSIFNYVFDKDKLEFKHQKRLLPLVKVTGRSFLSGDKDRSPANGNDTSAEGFCRKNDCAKLQRVIIKFTLKD